MSIKYYSLLAYALIVSGCFYESLDTERAYTSPKHPESMSLASQCQSSYSTGCVNGYLPAAPEIFVNGVQFEDANDIHDRFLSLVQFRDADGQLLSVSDVDFDLLTPVDNRSFAKGFQAYLKGAETRQADVLSNGTFVFQDLQPGVYEIRVIKRLRFAAKRRELAAEAQNLNEPKVLCATLVAENAVSVTVGTIESIIFDDYRLYWRDRDCGDDSYNQSSATL